MKPTIYTVALFKQGEGRPGVLDMETLFTSRNPEEIDELKKFMLEQNAGFRRSAQARNSREVVVVHVDQAEHDQYIASAGKNGLVSKPVRKGQTFRSATAASGHIGLRHNEVAMYLSKSAATGDKKATIRGVTFAYKDDV